MKFVTRSQSFRDELFESLQEVELGFANLQEAEGGERKGFELREEIEECLEKNVPFHMIPPRTLFEVVGVKDVILDVAEMLKARHFASSINLFTGDRGNGKTTTAIMLARKLSCKNFQLDCLGESCSHCRNRRYEVLEIKCNELFRNVKEIEDRIVKRAKFRFEDLAWSNYSTIVIILDELNKVANHMSVFLTRIVEEVRGILFIATINDCSLSEIDKGIESRAIRYKFKEPELEVISGWLYKYAHAKDIELSYLQAFVLSKSLNRNPRLVLKNLNQLCKRIPSSFDRRIRRICNINREEKLERIRDEFEQYELQIKLEADKWDIVER